MAVIHPPLEPLVEEDQGIEGEIFSHSMNNSKRLIKNLFVQNP